ncbi:hypothetical protein PTKU46_33510 [Paraburkholderia terrae]
MHAVRFEIERVRIERDTADAGRPVQLLAQVLFGYMPDQRRRGEKAEQSEQDQRDEYDENDASCSPALRDFADGLKG